MLRTWNVFSYLIPVLDIEGGPLLYPPHHWDVVNAALHAGGSTLESMP